MAKYTTEIQQYNKSFNVVGNCNVITFINNGGAAVTVNNYPLAASGGVLQIAGNAGELDITSYSIVIPPAGGDVWVIKKVDQK